MKRIGFLTLLCGGLLLVGCSSGTPASFDRTPTPDVMITTVAALQTQNAQLATQVAGLPATIENLPTATALPTLAPSQTLPPSLTPTETLAPTPTSIPTRAATRRPAPTATPVWPQILGFTVDPGEVNTGESVTLRWTTANVTRAVIQQASADGGSYNEVSVAPAGSIVLPIADRERLWHSFGLIVYNAAGNSTSNWINVSIRCPQTYFFAFPASEDQSWSCPDGPAVTTDAAEQYFENGRMIWLGTEQHIYVLLNGGEVYAYLDTWIAGQPDVAVTIEPPAGRYQPVRGFGKVWSADPYIRSRLGWAMAPEQGYQAQLQHIWMGCCSASDATNRPSYVREIDQRITRLWPNETRAGYWRFATY
jgi:hypothetical protein